MAFQSPLFSQLNGITGKDAKVARAFPVHAVVESSESAKGVGLFARFALAGAVGVSLFIFALPFTSVMLTSDSLSALSLTVR